MRSRELQCLKEYEVQLTDSRVSEVINSTLDYYVRQAVAYKRLFIALSIIIMLLNSSIPVINQVDFPGGKLLITILSSISLLITGVLSLVSVKETWSRYRESAEKLKSECNKFNGKVPPYNCENIKNNEIQLIHNFEQVNQAERRLWRIQENQKQEGTAGTSVGGTPDFHEVLSDIKKEQLEAANGQITNSCAIPNMPSEVENMRKDEEIKDSFIRNTELDEKKEG